MREVLGIDVSHHNGTIDWSQVSMADKKFAILKCQYEAKSHRKDETFEYNYKEAGKYGLSRGVYIFIASDSIADPVRDATSLITHLKKRPLEYGIWLDLESTVLRRLPKKEITRLCYIYRNIFIAEGYYVGIYCNKDWYDNVLESDVLKRDFDFWIARYPKDDKGAYNSTSKLKPSDIAVAWQYSSKGNVPGILTRCDLNVDFDGNVNLIASDYVNHKIIKSNRDIALEVIDGKWGSMSTRPTRMELLTHAGYDYNTIQRLVNTILKV